jgi:hypothetical protein
MQDNVDPPPRPPPRPIGRTQRLFETASKAGNDQIFKGDVIIKKLKNKHQYKITFSKVYGDRFFFYQVFNKDNTDSVNDKRFAAYIITKNIINEYNNYHNTRNIINKLVYIPTTIMELSNFSKYAFVINNTYFNSHKRLVFIVSTKEINIQNHSLKKLTQIPCGKFKHVRFDIDKLPLNQITLLDRKVKDLWDYINLKCIQDSNATQSFNGSPQLSLCDKQIPPYSDHINDVCKDTTMVMIRNNKSPDCVTKLMDIVKDGVELPEFFTYFISRSGFVDDLSKGRALNDDLNFTDCCTNLCSK